MGKLLNQTQDKFTIVQNCIFMDPHLSYHARGVLCTLLSLPDGWNFSIPGLETLVTTKTPDGKKSSHVRGDGSEGIRFSLQLLEKLGYLRRVRSQDENGKFDGYDYLICVPPVLPE